MSPIATPDSGPVAAPRAHRGRPARSEEVALVASAGATRELGHHRPRRAAAGERRPREPRRGSRGARRRAAGAMDRGPTVPAGTDIPGRRGASPRRRGRAAWLRNGPPTGRSVQPTASPRGHAAQRRALGGGRWGAPRRGRHRLPARCRQQWDRAGPAGRRAAGRGHGSADRPRPPRRGLGRALVGAGGGGQADGQLLPVPHAGGQLPGSGGCLRLRQLGSAVRSRLAGRRHRTGAARPAPHQLHPLVHGRRLLPLRLRHDRRVLRVRAARAGGLLPLVPSHRRRCPHGQQAPLPRLGPVRPQHRLLALVDRQGGADAAGHRGGGPRHVPPPSPPTADRPGRGGRRGLAALGGAAAPARHGDRGGRMRLPRRQGAGPRAAARTAVSGDRSACSSWRSSWSSR